VVARQRPRARHDGPFERQPLDALGQEACPTHPRRAGDHHRARAVGETGGELLEHLPVQTLPTHQRRLGIRLARPRRPPRLVPDALAQDRQRPAGLLADGGGEALAELVVGGQGARRIAAERHGAHQEARRRLVVGVERQRTTG